MTNHEEQFPWRYILDAWDKETPDDDFRNAVRFALNGDVVQIDDVLAVLSEAKKQGRTELLYELTRYAMSHLARRDHPDLPEIMIRGIENALEPDWRYTRPSDRFFTSSTDCFDALIALDLGLERPVMEVIMVEIVNEPGHMMTSGFFDIVKVAERARIVDRQYREDRSQQISIPEPDPRTTGVSIDQAFGSQGGAMSIDNNSNDVANAIAAAHLAMRRRRGSW